MAQDPATTPVEGTPAAANTADGKELVDPNHKPESAFEGHDKASKKEMKKTKRNKLNKLSLEERVIFFSVLPSKIYDFHRL